MNIFQQIDRKTKSKETGGQAIEIEERKPSIREKIKAKISDELSYRKELRSKEKKAYRESYENARINLVRKKAKDKATKPMFSGFATDIGKNRLSSETKGAGSNLRSMLYGESNNKTTQKRTPTKKTSKPKIKLSYARYGELLQRERELELTKKERKPINDSWF